MILIMSYARGNEVKMGSAEVVTEEELAGLMKLSIKGDVEGFYDVNEELSSKLGGDLMWKVYSKEPRCIDAFIYIFGNSTHFALTDYLVHED